MIEKRLVMSVTGEQQIKKTEHGFSLVELIAVVAVIGVLAAVSIPSYFTWLPNYRLKGAVRDLKGNFQNAKLEAIKRGDTVTVAFTTGVYSLAGNVGNYQIFIDANNNGVFDAGDTSIKQEFMPDKISLVSTTTAAVRFSSRGLPNVGGTVEMRNEDYFGQTVMSVAGRVKIERKPVGGVYATWD